MKKSDEKIVTILGLDPGYDRVGWAVGTAQGQKNTLLGYGCILTTKTKKIFERYKEIDQELSKIITQFNPTEAALETLFFARNTSTALSVSEARGVLLARCLQHNLSISEYKPSQVKLSVAGSGRADKTAVAKMVYLLGHIKATEKLLDDTTDAIAVFLTHANSRKMARTLSGSILLRSRQKL